MKTAFIRSVLAEAKSDLFASGELFYLATSAPVFQTPQNLFRRIPRQQTYLLLRPTSPIGTPVALPLGDQTTRSGRI